MTKHKHARQKNKQKLYKSSRVSKSSSGKKISSEFNFREITAQLAAKIDANLAKARKAEQSLKATIKKVEATIKAAAKLEKAANSKKQASAAKQKRTEAKNKLSALNHQFNQITAELATSQNEKSKLTSLGLLLAKFEKDWSKKAKKAKTKTKLASKPRKKSVKLAPELDKIEQLSLEQPIDLNSIENTEPTDIAA